MDDKKNQEIEVSEVENSSKSQEVDDLSLLTSKNSALKKPNLAKPPKKLTAQEQHIEEISRQFRKGSTLRNPFRGH